MKTTDFRQEEGQSLIQVALMLVVLIGFVGLALDGGNLYAERRRMQNAADAGALAGAWAMCKVNDPAAAKAKAVEYMQKNGDLDAAVGNVDIVGYKVTAHASKPVTPFLPFTFGGSVDVPANASAACGTANSMCAPWPIAFNEDSWNQLANEGACTSGKKIAIWNGQNDEKIPVSECTVKGVAKHKVCDCYQCKTGSEEFLFVNNANRAWVDFSPFPDLITGDIGNGCGTSELSDHVNGVSSVQVQIGKCVASLNGQHAGVKNDVMNQVNKNKNIVLYQPCDDEDGDDEDGDDEDGDDEDEGGCPGTPLKIVGLGCIKVASPGWDAIQPFKPVKDAKDLDGRDLKQIPKMTVIWAKMNCNGECDTSCGSTDGSPPDPNGINAANLVP